MHQLNIVAHVVAGIAAVMAGVVALTTIKGGRAHVRAGRLYVAIALAVIATAIVGVALFRSFPALAAATLAVGYQVVSSLRALARCALGPSAIDTALAALALLAIAGLMGSMGPGNASWTPAIGYPILGLLAAVATYDLSRPLWREVWIRRAWRLDHGLKMTNAFFGMVSAGTGNLFPGLQPLSQVGPSFLGTAVVLILTIRHWPRS